MSTTTFRSALPRIRRRFRVLHARHGWHVAIRVAQWTVGSVLALWLLYVVVANALLRSQWTRHKVNDTPQTLQVDYATAWTLIPGIFHMTNVSGWGQFTDFEYAGHVDHLRINVGVIGLLHHKVVLHIHARGFALQGKPAASVKPQAPPIDAPVPLHQIAAPPVPVVDESLAKWTIHVDLDLRKGRELWVDAVRYEGPIEATGAMNTTPNRSFDIKDFRLDVRDGQVFVGKKTALPHFMAAVDVKLDAVDPRGVDVGAFNRLTVDAKVGGVAGEMSFVQDIAPMPLKFGGDGGRFEVEGRLDHGKIAAPGTAHVTSDGIWVGFAGTGVRGAVVADGRLDDSPDGPVAHLTAEVTKGEVTTAKGATFVVIPVTRSTATASHLDLSNPKNMRFEFSAKVPHAVIPHLSVLDAFIASPDVRITAGKVAGAGGIEGDFPKGALHGAVTFSTDPPMVMTLDKTTRLEGRLQGKIPIVRASSDSDFVLTGAEAHATDTALDNGGSHTSKWWGDVNLPKGRLHLVGSPAYIGSIHATFRDIDPVITAISQLHGIPDWVNRMLGIGPYQADATGTFGAVTKIDLADAQSHAENFPSQPHTRVRATYDGRTTPPTWRTDVEFGVLAIGIEKDKHLSFHPIEVAKWFDRAAGLAR